MSLPVCRNAFGNAVARFRTRSPAPLAARRTECRPPDAPDRLTFLPRGLAGSGDRYRGKTRTFKGCGSEIFGLGYAWRHRLVPRSTPGRPAPGHCGLRTADPKAEDNGRERTIKDRLRCGSANSMHRHRNSCHRNSCLKHPAARLRARLLGELSHEQDERSSTGLDDAAVGDL